MKSNSYLLEVGEKDRQRLEILNQLCNPGSVLLAKEAKIGAGSHVLDLGCGIGLMSCELGNLVGDRGKVVGVDISEEQLKIARTNVEKAQLHNVEFTAFPAEQLAAFQQSFDYIYTRFMLCHISDPGSVISCIGKLLRPGGTFICEDAAFCTSEPFFPEDHPYNRWMRVVSLQFHLQGTDPFIGMKLPNMLLAHGYHVTQMQLRQPMMQTGYEKRLMRLGVDQVSPALAAAGVFPKEEACLLQQDLLNFEGTDVGVPFCRYAQIIAQKRTE